MGVLSALPAYFDLPSKPITITPLVCAVLSFLHIFCVFPLPEFKPQREANWKWRLDVMLFYRGNHCLDSIQAFGPRRGVL